ncbi:MAG: carbon-nitrogen hydrolase family protein [Rubrivivax sp.]
MTTATTRIAVVQHAPAMLDREATLEKAVALVAEAARGGARLVVFPEAFVPGYPAWVWRLRPGADMGLAERIHARLLANAVDLAAGQLAPLQAAAREHGVTVVCGLHERDGEFSRATLYNTAVMIGPGGELLNRHRKVMPTNPERMVWGFGDASGLRAVPTPVGRVGTLICWENYMPQARLALYGEGVEVLVAPTYDSGERWLASAQHIAREGGSWVVGAGCVLQGRDLPRDLPGRETLFPDDDEWINGGDSVVVAPGGKVVAGPLHNERGFLFAEIDLERVASARRSLDVVGHYARPDLFTLHIDRRPQRPVRDA